MRTVEELIEILQQIKKEYGGDTQVYLKGTFHPLPIDEIKTICMDSLIDKFKVVLQI